jgi:HKD family nuclease
MSKNEILFNIDKDENHNKKILTKLEHAEQVIFMVAFANNNKAFNELYEKLSRFLDDGQILTARIAIGRDYSFTAPRVLEKLLSLQNNFPDQFELYVNDKERYFHPKIYLFKNKKQSSLIIGSANLTDGGLMNNCEASILIEDNIKDNSALSFITVNKYFNTLIKDKSLIKATDKLINEYLCEYIAEKKNTNKSHEITKDSIKMAKNNLNLSDLLRIMKNDDSNNGFKCQIIERRKNLEKSIC